MKALVFLSVSFILIALAIAAVHLSPAKAGSNKQWSGPAECYSDAPIHSSTWSDHDCASTVQRF